MKVLYVKPLDSTFIRIDEDILKRNFETKVFLLSNSSIFSYVFSTLHLCYFVLANRKNIGTIFTRFADYHTYPLVILSKILKFKFIVVVGGFEVAKIPELNYGAFLNRFRGFCVRKTFLLATKILPNTKKLIWYENSFGLKKSVKGGILHFVPSVKNKITVVNNGFDSGKFNFTDIKRDDIILNVAIILDDKSYYRKGMDIFLKAAEILPHFKFIQVGMSKEYLEDKAIHLPPNVEIYERTNEVLTFFQKSKVFFIPSRAEGMPNALCEAMLCGCIPVGANINSIPDIIGEDKLILFSDNLSEISKKLSYAVKISSKSASKFRDIIKENYSIEIRESKLLNEINS